MMMDIPLYTLYLTLYTSYILVLIRYLVISIDKETFWKN